MHDDVTIADKGEETLVLAVILFYLNCHLQFNFRSLANENSA
jgi:hypothetical protein